MRKEKLYTVRWSRVGHETNGIMECTGLNLRTAMARLRGAIDNTGPIIVHEIIMVSQNVGDKE